MAYKRKYRKGSQLIMLDDIFSQEFIYVYDKVYHKGWFMNWDLRRVKNLFDRGALFYAEKVEEDCRKASSSLLV